VDASPAQPAARVVHQALFVALVSQDFTSQPAAPSAKPAAPSAPHARKIDAHHAIQDSSIIVDNAVPSADPGVPSAISKMALMKKLNWKPKPKLYS